MAIPQTRMARYNIQLYHYQLLWLWRTFVTAGAVKSGVFCAARPSGWQTIGQGARIGIYLREESCGEPSCRFNRVNLDQH